VTTTAQRDVARNISTFLSIHPQALLTPEDGALAIDLLESALKALDPDLEPLDGVDVTNWQMVGTDSRTVTVTLPATSMSKDAALVHAAWLVTLADPLHERFPQIERMVHNT